MGTELRGSADLNAVLSYTTDDAWALGMKTNEVESYQLPWGYELTLYDNDGFSGESYTITGVHSTEPNGLLTCYDLPDDWRNRAESYEVRKVQEFGPAKLTWVPI